MIKLSNTLQESRTQYSALFRNLPARLRISKGYSDPAVDTPNPKDLQFEGRLNAISYVFPANSLSIRTIKAVNQVSFYPPPSHISLLFALPPPPFFLCPFFLSKEWN